MRFWSGQGECRRNPDWRTRYEPRGRGLRPARISVEIPGSYSAVRWDELDWRISISVIGIYVSCSELVVPIMSKTGKSTRFGNGAPVSRALIGWLSPYIERYPHDELRPPPHVVDVPDSF